MNEKQSYKSLVVDALVAAASEAKTADDIHAISKALQAIESLTTHSPAVIVEDVVTRNSASIPDGVLDTPEPRKRRYRRKIPNRTITYQQIRDFDAQHSTWTIRKVCEALNISYSTYLRARQFDHPGGPKL